MSAARPVVNVYAENGTDVKTSIKLPDVFKSPIRPDLVSDTHAHMAKNKRQPYAVSRIAGHQTSAISWGTGRAVSRIPRVSGGGTHRAGQGAYGNMCRGGRMFAPTKTWRRWHRKINANQKRYAVASALAASAVPSLVLARGHRIMNVSEIPLVVADEMQSCRKTSAAVKLLQNLKAFDDVIKVKESRVLRAGAGKMRNRRHRQRRGPLVCYNEDTGLTKAFRNIPGVEIASVHSLNLLQLAPGGHIGRFVIWTESAINQLDTIFGTQTAASKVKKEYHLPLSVCSNPDIARIIQSDEIQSVIRPALPRPVKSVRRTNPLKNKSRMAELNPHACVKREVEKEKRLASRNRVGAKKFLASLADE